MELPPFDLEFFNKWKQSNSIVKECDMDEQTARQADPYGRQRPRRHWYRKDVIGWGHRLHCRRQIRKREYGQVIWSILALHYRWGVLVWSHQTAKLNPVHVLRRITRNPTVQMLIIIAVEKRLIWEDWMNYRIKAKALHQLEVFIIGILFSFMCFTASITVINLRT